MAALVRISFLLVAALLPLGVKAQYAAAYVLADHTSGYVLESYKSDQKRPIASLTKIATAKVVLDWAASTGTDLSQLISIPTQAIRAYGTNPIGLQPDDQMSYRDLIYSAMMESDGTAAQALAYTVGGSLRSRAAGSLGELGSTEAFVTQMNALARQLGMEKTLFVNADGLEPEKGAQPYSTAADVTKLVAYAMNDAGFRFYVSQKERKVAFVRGGQLLQYLLRNTNELLGTNGVDGVKTGTTTRAGQCIALSSQKDPEIRKEGETTYVTPRRIDIVILGAADRFAAAEQLLGRAWGLYEQWSAAGRPMQTSKH
jgi:serine-type D-Ala-D-Ala carboxypeptidase (penicillin-binding protein 5/6)